MRQWVLSVPFALRYLFATDPAVMGQVLGIVTRAIASHLIKAAGMTYATAQTGAVTLIDGALPCAPPFGRPAVVQIGSPADLSASAVRSIHFDRLFLDGVYVTSGDGLSFRRVPQSP